MKKNKILILSDHALSPSGVGVQTRFLVHGLLKKECWTVRQLGAALKHENYDLVKVSEDFLIKPIDGFGNPDLIRSLLIAEKPDVVLLFTDPRFFVWFWEIEDEVHQICPIAYWHVWDNKPFPTFNNSFYESTDLINCHSHHTFEQVREHFPDRTNFIPHALPTDLFFKLSEPKIRQNRINLLGKDREKDFVLFWVSRNAKRKRPSDIIWSFKLFLDKIKEDGKRTPATLLMHTDPNDPEGPNLFEVVKMLGVEDNVFFSTEKLDFEEINVLHNIADCSINLSFAEGFGLGTLESMQCGTPIIAPKTGGLTRQVVDHRDGSENGVALDIEFKSLVGSQTVPFIYEDYVSVETVSEAILKMYKMSKEDRDKLGQKCIDYVHSEFNFTKTVDMWHETLLETINKWKKGEKLTKSHELVKL